MTFLNNSPNRLTWTRKLCWKGCEDHLGMTFVLPDEQMQIWTKLLLPGQIDERRCSSFTGFKGKFPAIRVGRVSHTPPYTLHRPERIDKCISQVLKCASVSNWLAIQYNTEKPRWNAYLSVLIVVLYCILLIIRYKVTLPHWYRNNKINIYLLNLFDIFKTVHFTWRDIFSILDTENCFMKLYK